MTSFQIPQHRLARLPDLPALDSLMERAITRLLPAVYSPGRIRAVQEFMSVDRHLIEDGTFFIIEYEGYLVGGGGWSKRASQSGNDRTRLLDPSREPARVRAMCTDPRFSRRGIGRRILELCEAAAREAGFSRLELGATLLGVALYQAYGFTEFERSEAVSSAGIHVPIVLMEKQI